MLRIALVLAFVALGFHGAFAQARERELGKSSGIVEDNVKQAVKTILTLYQADGVGEALPALRMCYDGLNSTAPFARIERCMAMDVALCLVLDVKALQGSDPVADFCEAGRSGRRMAYWADEAVADRKDRPAFLLALFTYARAGMSEYFGRKAQTNNTTP